MLTVALLGFVFGFIGSMPVAGPIAILVFGRGLEGRFRSGVYLAIGAAIAESVYAYLAYWGFSELLSLHPWVEPVTRTVAAVLLIGLGLHFTFGRKKTQEIDPELVEQKKNVGNKRSFLLGFTVTALNPTLIATWSGAVTALHSFDAVDFAPRHALPFSVGALFGIAVWFTMLLLILGRFRGRFSRTTLDKMVRAMGVFLILLGLYFGVKLLIGLTAQSAPKASVERSDLVKGWGPDGFAGGAGERRTFPRYLVS
jgi:threonine/homoserine/homoserine lactone efflux protein